MSRSRVIGAIMAGQIQLTFLLAIIACVVHSVPLAIDTHSIVDDVEIRANLDKTVDDLLPSIRKLIVKNGMDPMRITDISEYIFPDLPGKLKGSLDLQKGWVQNLSQVKRTNNVTAIYKNKRLTLDMNLGFNVMDFNYEYYLKHLLYKRQGDVYGRLYDLDVNVVATVDLKEYHLILDSIKFSDIGKYDIKFEGHILDNLLNAITKIITTVFRSRILPVIEDFAAVVFKAKLDEWNTKLPKPSRIEIINTWLDIVEKKIY